MDKFHLIVLKTAPQLNSNINFTKTFGPLNEEEIDLYINLWRKYPNSVIKQIWGTRTIDGDCRMKSYNNFDENYLMPYSYNDYNDKEIEVKDVNKGNIDFSNSFEGGNVLYLHDPNYTPIGCVNKVKGEYNDQGYDCTQHVVVYGIFIQK